MPARRYDRRAMPYGLLRARRCLDHVTERGLRRRLSRRRRCRSARSTDEGAIGSRLPARLPPSRGRVFYVSTAGSDENPGTRRRPWRTIQMAIDSLRPGQTAVVHGGVYVESLVVERAGAPGKTITIRNCPGDRPIVHERGRDAIDYPLRITAGAAHIRFTGFVLEGQRVPSNQTVWISDGQRTGPPPTHDIELSHCEVRNGVGSGILVCRTRGTSS